MSSRRLSTSAGNRRSRYVGQRTHHGAHQVGRQERDLHLRPGQAGDLGVPIQQVGVRQALLGPPTSSWLGPSIVAAPISAATTSTTAIGCTREFIQSGTVCTGIRSLTCRMISNEVDPEPITTAARRVITVAGESVRIRSTSSRTAGARTVPPQGLPG